MRPLLVLVPLLATACSISRLPAGHHDGGTPAEDGGPRADAPAADGGWCECPPPMPGCRWVGSPCPCSAYVCDDAGPGVCGGFTGATCAAGEYCDYQPDSCGVADQSGICVPRPMGCDLLYDPHCGCDGTTYSNACAAHVAGVDVAHRGACGAAGCEPDDATGVGLCDAIVGVAWDGITCRHLSGCSCEGADCGRWSSLEDCQTAHGHCPVPAGG